jgi:hypothetical protein
MGENSIDPAKLLSIASRSTIAVRWSIATSGWLGLKTSPGERIPWAVEIGLVDNVSLVLVLDARKLQMPLAAAEQLARALDSRRQDFRAGNVGRFANEP